MQNIQDQLNTIIKLFNNGDKQNAFNKISLILPTNEKNIELLLRQYICLVYSSLTKEKLIMKQDKKLVLTHFFQILRIKIYSKI